MLITRREICIGGTGVAVAAACVGVCALASSTHRSKAKRAAALLTPEFVTTMINDSSGVVDEKGARTKIRVFDVTIPQIAYCGDGKASTTDRIVVKLEASPVHPPHHAMIEGQSGWSVDQTHELCETGKESAFEGKAPLLKQFNSVSGAVEALSNDASICPEGMCLVLSTSQGKCYVIFRADMESRVLAKFRLFCDDSCGDVPEQLIFKCNLLPSFMRVGASPWMLSFVSLLGKAFGIVGLGFLVYRSANVVNYYLPHAPDSMYENETRFYRDVRPELSIETPRCYGTLYSPKSREFGILMEDLGAKGATFPTAVDDVPVERVRDLLKSLARLHARHWESPRLEKGGDLSWLPTPRCGGMADVFQKLGRGLIADHVRADPIRREKIKPIGLSVDKLWEGLLKAEEALMVPPLTLCHGDAHVQNTYWLDDGTVGLFDWQLTLKCSWARDFAYVLGTGLSRTVRRENERALLDLYLNQLAANGVPRVPLIDDAFLLYRKTMAWCLVIGWLICPPNNYGPEITGANIDKLVDACVDLESFKALGIA